MCFKRKPKPKDQEQDNKGDEENDGNEGDEDAEGVGTKEIPPLPCLLTMAPESVAFKESENKINFDDKFDEIQSLCTNDEEQQDKFFENIENKYIQSIQFLILQLATLKSYSKSQTIDDGFKEKERNNYHDFLAILNKYDFNSEDSSEKIIDEILEKYKNE